METKQQHKTKTERLGHMESWEQSGMSKAAYSKEHQINYVTFCSWFTKMQSQNTNAVAQKFIPVEVTSTDVPAPASFATLTFSTRLRIELHSAVSASFIKQLIACK